MTTRRTVILAAHGAGDDSAANSFTRAVASALSLRRPDLEVVAAFNLGSPGFVEALDASTGEHVTVVPLMTSDGWFVRERLPALLGESRRHGQVSVRITAPVGAVRSVLREFRDRAAGAALASAAGGQPTALLVVGHGTTRRRSSGDATRALAQEIAESIRQSDRRADDLLAAAPIEVVAAFLDESPRLEEVAQRFEDRSRLILPFLLGGGDHAGRDLRERVLGDPEASERDADAARTRFLPALAATPSLVIDAALALIDWHDPARRLRLGTRGSALARRQAEIVAAALAAHGVPTTLTIVDTQGDRDQRTAIEAFPTDGPFTDDLEAALAAEEIDLAVHSQKDLPLPGDVPPGGAAGALWMDTAVVAVLMRGAVDEALVTTTGSTLADLPPGSRIGTCSSRRAAQLCALRQDLRTVPMRGPVDARLAAVARGEVDGAILAVAGLERLGALDRIAERFELDEMLPEAGQGAIAVTARSDDAPAAEACASIDHPPSRIAVQVERTIAAAIEGARAGTERGDGGRRRAIVAAVHAVAAPGAEAWEVSVRARAIDLGSGGWHEARVTGERAETAVASAVAALRAASCDSRTGRTAALGQPDETSRWRGRAAASCMIIGPSEKDSTTAPQALRDRVLDRETTR